MKNLISKRAINFALKRCCPASIPMSDKTKVMERNYFCVDLCDEQRRKLIWLTGTTEQGLVGRFYDIQYDMSFDVSVPYSLLDRWRISITYYLREIEIRYDSVGEFYWHSIFFIPNLTLLKERTSQRFFNKRKLARLDRMAILRHFLENSLKSREYAASAFDIVTALFGRRWIQHPDNEPLLAYYKLLMTSLVHSNDLSLDNQHWSYKLAPHALLTLANFEEDERRHRDAVAQNRTIKWLTFFLVLVGVLELSSTIQKGTLLWTWLSRMGLVG